MVIVPGLVMLGYGAADAIGARNGLSHSNETIHLKYGYLFFTDIYFQAPLLS